MNVVQTAQASKNPVLDAGPALLRITAAQFSVMVEAGAFPGDAGVELRGGLLYRMNPQCRPHLIAKTKLHKALFDALQALGSSLFASSEGSVQLGDDEVPQPDLIVWELAGGGGPVPGELVRIAVEVSDTTVADDLGRKRSLYAAASLPEYWIVDLPGRVVHQYWAPADGAYARSAVVPFGETLRSKTLEGLAIPTAALGWGQTPG